MSEVDQYLQGGHVYLGVWNNWSRGPITGLTLTLTHKHGAFLIAFLTLLVTFTGRSFWKIARLIAHRYLSRTSAQDAVYHQRQAVLRNTDSSSSALWRFLRISWAWRGNRANNVYRRNAGLILLNASITSVFMAASLLSSQVANSMGNEVLISSPYCSWFGGDIVDANEVDTLSAYHMQLAKSAANYADLCYAKDGSKGDCRVYPKARLPYSVSRGIECPFPGKDKICQTPSGAIRFDTGFVNSHDDMGFNAKPEHRYLWRTVAECAPLKTEGYVSFEKSSNSSSPVPREFISYLFGKTAMYGNKTYQRPTDPPGNIELGYVRRRYDLKIVSFATNINGTIMAEASSIWPIPDIATPTADGCLMFLSSNDILFWGEINDPWFSAHKFAGNITSLGREVDAGLYARDDPARVLGCLQKHQYCNPMLPKDKGCTPLESIASAVAHADGLWQNDMQRFLFNWTRNAEAAMIDSMPSWLDDKSLLAPRTLAGSYQAHLPDNQWELELEYWFEASLALEQRIIVNLASGPSNPAVRKYFIRPNTTAEKNACSRQKFRSDSFTSFSVLGLFIILMVSILTISISVGLPWITKRQQMKGNPYKSLEWTTNETLQLQRLAHEALGAGSWRGASDDYPTTESGQRLAILDTSHHGHPRLKLVEEDPEEDGKASVSRMEEIDDQ